MNLLRGGSKAGGGDGDSGDGDSGDGDSGDDDGADDGDDDDDGGGGDNDMHHLRDDATVVKVQPDPVVANPTPMDPPQMDPPLRTPLGQPPEGLLKSLYGQTRLKKYSKLTKAQQLQDECDVQATNIVLHGLPPDVYALVNHHEAAMDIWDRAKLLMKGTELSYQERECRLMTMQQVQVNTKFLNALPLEWSKFVTDVKLPKNLYTTNYDQLYAYLSQHEREANELKPRNQATIQDGRVTIQQVQGRQTQSFTVIGNKGIATTSRGNSTAGQARVVKCYNCLGEGHMVKQCTQPKRPRNSAWFKEKLMLAEAQEAGQILDEEQLAFISEPRIEEASISQQTIPQNSAFQTEDLDAYDLNCDNISSAKVVLMENLSSCDSDVPSLNNEITSDSNIIPYSKYPQESQDAVIQHDVISVIDDEETLILEEESQSKMLDNKMIQFP
ncbi:integrase, catalytic region, zinc finger, CCHC-type containing protein [Tanacetum coccineum]